MEESNIQVTKRVFLTSRNREPYQPKPLDSLGSPKPKFVRRVVMITLEVIIMIATIILMACGLSISSLHHKKLWSFYIWELALISMVTVAARRISYGIVTIFGLLIRWIFKSKQQVVYLMFGLQEAARLWMTTIFIITPCYILILKKAKKKGRHEVLLKLMDVLFAVLIISSLWFTKSILSMCCAARFHWRNYKERIEESLFYWYIVQGLSNYSWFRFQHLSDPKKTTAWDMKRILMDQKYYGLGVMFKNESELETAANRIFSLVAKRGSEFIDVDDISRFIPRHDAMKTLNLFREMNGDETTRISSPLFQEWLVHAFTHEKHLVMTMKNMDVIANKVNGATNLLVGILLAILFLPLVGLVHTKSLMIFSLNAFIATFFFGNMWKTTFDSIVLVFVEHPFDVGDRCEIQEVEMIVEDIQIMSTQFVGLDQKKYRYTNLDLWTKGICNHDRSRCTTWGEIYLEKMKEKNKND